MMRLRPHLMRSLLVVLLALALAMVGYGHRMALPDAPDLSAYAMPDGTLPVLCLVDGQDAQKHMADAPCPACVISAALQMPPVVAVPAIALGTGIVIWPLPGDVHGRAHAARAPPARGPPSSFLI
jgi:hypothetical protein